MRERVHSHGKADTEFELTAESGIVTATITWCDIGARNSTLLVS